MMEVDTRPELTNNVSIMGKLEKYGKLQYCTRRQLMDYCLRMQDLARNIDSALFGHGVFVSIDDKDNVHVKTSKCITHEIKE